MINATIAKYEKFIADNFEPDFPLHESRPHSNLNGKLILYQDNMLASDPIGYYSKDVLISGEPTGVGYYEEYPHMTGSWVYTSVFHNDDFDYNEEKPFIAELNKEATREALDDASRR